MPQMRPFDRFIGRTSSRVLLHIFQNPVRQFIDDLEVDAGRIRAAESKKPRVNLAAAGRSKKSINFSS